MKTFSIIDRIGILCLTLKGRLRKAADTLRSKLADGQSPTNPDHFMAFGGIPKVPLVPDGQLEPVLTDWRMPEGGLYFVTPTARARPRKFPPSRISSSPGWRTRRGGPRWYWDGNRRHNGET